ncbi:hypothetical protein LAD67_08465 [Escherichia coli]|nr:hypothetical protein [Escherichia coli]
MSIITVSGDEFINNAEKTQDRDHARRLSVLATGSFTVTRDVESCRGVQPHHRRYPGNLEALPVPALRRWRLGEAVIQISGSAILDRRGPTSGRPP